MNWKNFSVVFSFILQYLVLVLDCWCQVSRRHKVSSAHYVNSPVVDEENDEAGPQSVSPAVF